MRNTTPNDLILVGVAARLLDLSPLRVRQLIDAGDIPVAVRTETGMRLVRRRDVERLAARREREASRAA